jgi:hypothetical protein
VADVALVAGVALDDLDVAAAHDPDRQHALAWKISRGT